MAFKTNLSTKASLAEFKAAAEKASRSKSYLPQIGEKIGTIAKSKLADALRIQEWEYINDVTGEKKTGTTPVLSVNGIEFALSLLRGKSVVNGIGQSVKVSVSNGWTSETPLSEIITFLEEGNKEKPLTFNVVGKETFSRLGGNAYAVKCVDVTK